MKYFQLLQKKTNLVSLKKQPHVPSGFNLQSPVGVQKSNPVFKQKRDCKTNGEMGKSKTKAIQVDLGIFLHIRTYPGIFRHIHGYSRIIQAYSEPCVTLTCSELWYIQNPGIFKTRGIFRTLVYPKLWHIQNPGIFRKTEAYSEPCQTSVKKCFWKQLTAIIIFVSYNYFHNISLLCPLVHEINMIFLMQV